MNSHGASLDQTLHENSVGLGPEPDRVGHSDRPAEPRAGASRKTHRSLARRLCLFGVVAGSWLILLGMAYVGYLYMTVPLQRQVLAHEVRSLELALDAVIRERCLVVDAIVGNLEMDTFLRQGAMPNMVKRIRSTFPEFVTLQVLDQEGTILAMAGDVSIPGGVLPSTVKIEWPADSGGLPAGWRFSDEPSENRWLLTCKHSGSRAGVWFVRATFSREPLLAATARAGLDEGRPFGLTRFAGTYRSCDFGVEANSGGSPVWFSGGRWIAVSRAETPLRAGGWLVSVDGAPSTASLFLYPAVVAGVFFLCVLGSLVVMNRPAPSDDGHKPRENSSEPPPVAAYAAVVVEHAAPALGTTAGTAGDTELAAPAEPHEEQIVAMSAQDDELPEFIEVTWVEPAHAAEQELPSDAHSTKRFPSIRFTSAGA